MNNGFEFVAIALQVVTRRNGQARLACSVAQTQAINQQLGQSRRVAFFGDGESDPTSAWSGNGVQDMLAFGGGHAGLPQRARHVPFNAIGTGNPHGILAVLRAQFVDQTWLSHTHAMNAPAYIAFAQQLIEHHGLVRTVKRA